MIRRFFKTWLLCAALAPAWAATASTPFPPRAGAGEVAAHDAVGEPPAPDRPLDAVGVDRAFQAARAWFDAGLQPRAFVWYQALARHPAITDRAPDESIEGTLARQARHQDALYHLARCRLDIARDTAARLEAANEFVLIAENRLRFNTPLFSGEAKHWAGRAYYDAGRWPEAVRWFLLAQEAPDLTHAMHGDTAWYLARAYFAQLDELPPLAVDDPDGGVRRRELIRRAMDELNRAELHFPDGPRHAEIQLAKAERLLVTGDPLDNDRAVGELSQYLHDHPERGPARARAALLRVRGLFASARLDEAVEAAGDLIDQENPPDEIRREAWLMLARAHAARSLSHTPGRRRRELSAALDAYAEALRDRAPDTAVRVAAHLAAARAALELDRPRDAARWLEPLLQNGRARPLANWYAGEAARRSGRGLQAARHYRIVALGRGAPELMEERALFYLGRDAAERGDWGEAVAWFGRAAAAARFGRRFDAMGRAETELARARSGFSAAIAGIDDSAERPEWEDMTSPPPDAAARRQDAAGAVATALSEVFAAARRSPPGHFASASEPGAGAGGVEAATATEWSGRIREAAGGLAVAVESLRAWERGLAESGAGASGPSGARGAGGASPSIPEDAFGEHPLAEDSQAGAAVRLLAHLVERPPPSLPKALLREELARARFWQAHQGGLRALAATPVDLASARRAWTEMNRAVNAVAALEDEAGQPPRLRFQRGKLALRQGLFAAGMAARLREMGQSAQADDWEANKTARLQAALEPAVEVEAASVGARRLRAVWLRARVEELLGRVDAALAGYERLAREPEADDNLRLAAERRIAACLETRGDLPAAIERFRRMADRDAEAALAAARMEERLGWQARAWEDYHRAADPSAPAWPPYTPERVREAAFRRDRLALRFPSAVSPSRPPAQTVRQALSGLLALCRDAPASPWATAAAREVGEVLLASPDGWREAAWWTDALLDEAATSPATRRALYRLRGEVRMRQGAFDEALAALNLARPPEGEGAASETAAVEWAMARILEAQGREAAALEAYLNIFARFDEVEEISDPSRRAAAGLLLRQAARNRRDGRRAEAETLEEQARGILRGARDRAAAEAFWRDNDPTRE